MVDEPKAQEIIEGHEGAHGHEGHDEQRYQARVAGVAEDGGKLLAEMDFLRREVLLVGQQEGGQDGQDERD